MKKIISVSLALLALTLTASAATFKEVVAGLPKQASIDARNATVAANLATVKAAYDALTTPADVAALTVEEKSLLARYARLHVSKCDDAKAAVLAALQPHCFKQAATPAQYEALFENPAVSPETRDRVIVLYRDVARVDSVDPINIPAGDEAKVYLDQLIYKWSETATTAQKKLKYQRIRDAWNESYPNYTKVKELAESYENAEVKEKVAAGLN